MLTSLFRVVLLLVFVSGMQNVQAIEFGVFGDFTLAESTAETENVNFAVGALDFYATQEFSENTRGFIELVFENGSSGLVTDLERFWVMRTFSDEINISAGRFHTPLGRWNRTYHHGAFVQESKSRPFFLDFEDGATGVLPVHIVGVMFTGDFIRENYEMSYELAIGNGPSINTANGGLTPGVNPEIDINSGSDNNDNKSVSVRVVYGHDALPVKFGVFAMNNEVAESAVSGGLTSRGSSLVSQVIYGTDILLKYNAFEFLSEYYLFDNSNNVGTSGSYSASAWYTQLSYKINEDYKILVRLEGLHFDEANDSYFRILGTEEGKHAVLALRYEMDEANVIKFEMDTADNQSSPDFTQYILQWAFLIP